MSSHKYTKVVNSDRLILEIQDSSITASLQEVATSGGKVTITFKLDLDYLEVETLDAIVANHIPEPLVIPDLVSISGPKDSDGSLLNRTKLTKTGWHAEPRVLTWTTAKAASLHNRKGNGYSINGGTDHADAWMKFYTSAGQEIIKGAEESLEDYQARLLASCTCTQLFWQPKYDIEMISGDIRFSGNTGSKASGWVIFAPDIPEAYGGSVPFLTGGLPLGMINERERVNIDGRTPKFIAYDPIYNTNKAKMVVVHSAGEQVTVMLKIDLFRG